MGFSTAKVYALKENSAYINQEESRKALPEAIPSFPQPNSQAGDKIAVPVCMPLSEQIDAALAANYPESWWQSLLEKHIPLLLPGYVQCFSKINIGIGRTKFPDFLLQTQDGYLDVLEIKRPDTELFTKDNNHDNYSFSKVLSNAISQVNRYVEETQKHCQDLQEYIQEKHKSNVRVLHPTGIILAGDRRNFSQHEKDDFRRLTRMLTNIKLITYDDLHFLCKRQETSN